MLALHVFGWFKEERGRKALEISLAGGTDNRANEALTTKRSTTKWPLMGINMQLSASLSRARLALGLRWRPREENIEADQLTNENFEGFDMALRIAVDWGDVDLSVLNDLAATREGFIRARESAKELANFASGTKSKKFDKSPW